MKQNLKIWSSYVQEQDVDDVAMGTVISQLYNSPGYYSHDSLIKRWLKIFHDTQMLVSVNIAALLQTSKDRTRTIDLHIAHISKKLDEMNIIVDQLKDMIQKKQEISTSCLDRKKQWDRTFLQGITENNPKLVEEWLKISTNDAPCYITNRIQANAYTYLIERIQWYKTALLKRKSLLENNKATLVTYGDQLDSSMDIELSNIKNKVKELQNYEYAVYSNIKNWNEQTSSSQSLDLLSNFFNYGFPSDTNNVPKLKFWFNDNNTNVPNFINGAFKNPSSSPIKDWWNTWIIDD